MFDGLIELVFQVWRGDREMRESSAMGQSEMDRKSGRVVAWICGGLVTVLVVAGIAWTGFVER